MAAPKEPRDVSWPTGTVLQALGAQKLAKGQNFTNVQLKVWLPQLTSLQRQRVTAKLTRGNLISLVARELQADGGHLHCYRVTEAGNVAINTAMEGMNLRSGPRPQGHARSSPFARRLWALVRAKGILDSDGATSTLVDAGEDYVAARKKVRHYLMGWAKAGALQVASQRVNKVGRSNGCKRYVLVKDGPNPPDWSPKVERRRAQA